ncbi:hypothetical protein ATE92_0402 [Ulvibacter sp. MAR_2010_11]|uniref:hypothetical protein n=1 Tax=Ulvibacter sp. MAR_2010_11 TaxID=1250229 RepID=UPI000C2BDCDA|nr:hypothetical protein [Ulvibacter sp. MAR_2010_11]PKA82275.1 hypothetical protein ATE92_0402 [Ulvibacter sp. MAR_2010_11]
MYKVLILLPFLSLIIGCKNETKTSEAADVDSEKNLTTAEAIAHKNGIQHWSTISELKFTFNVDRGENHYERSWMWLPKTNDVTLITKEDTLAFNRASLDSLSQQADAIFINDSYWLLAPFKLVWDKGTTFSEREKAIAPISKDTMHQLTIVYSNEGGYTPGDAYDFYYTDTFTIKEWVFRKRNDSLPSVVTTWEDYETFSELTLAKTRRDSTGNFKLYFTDISVK